MLPELAQHQQIIQLSHKIISILSLLRTLRAACWQTVQSYVIVSDFNVPATKVLGLEYL